MARSPKSGDSAPKPARARKPAAAPAPAPAAARPDPAPPGPTLRKKELIERVVAASGARRKDVRAIVEATLTVLGEALARNEQLALPPFGKARVNRQKDLARGEMLTVKLRRSPARATAKAGDEALAEDAD